MDLLRETSVERRRRQRTDRPGSPDSLFDLVDEATPKQGLSAFGYLRANYTAGPQRSDHVASSTLGADGARCALRALELSAHSYFALQLPLFHVLSSHEWCRRPA